MSVSFAMPTTGVDVLPDSRPAGQPTSVRAPAGGGPSSGAAGGTDTEVARPAGPLSLPSPSPSSPGDGGGSEQGPLASRTGIKGRGRYQPRFHAISPDSHAGCDRRIRLSRTLVKPAGVIPTRYRCRHASCAAMFAEADRA